MDEKSHKSFFHDWISAYADRLHLVKQSPATKLDLAVPSPGAAPIPAASKAEQPPLAPKPRA